MIEVIKNEKEAIKALNELFDWFTDSKSIAETIDEVIFKIIFNDWIENEVNVSHNDYDKMFLLRELRNFFFELETTSKKNDSTLTEK